MDTPTLLIIGFFVLSSVLGHALLHRVIKTPAQYYRPSQQEGWIGAAVR
jgi:hypothetical protein